MAEKLNLNQYWVSLWMFARGVFKIFRIFKKKVASIYKVSKDFRNNPVDAVLDLFI